MLKIKEDRNCIKCGETVIGVTMEKGYCQKHMDEEMQRQYNVLEDVMKEDDELQKILWKKYN